MRLFIFAVCILMLIYLLLIIFKWDWVKEKLIRGRKARMYEWIEYNWGETAERIVLGGICVLAIVCFMMAFITGQI